MNPFDNSFTVEEGAFFVVSVDIFLFRQGHISIVKRPKFFKIRHNVAVVNNFLNISVGSSNLMTFDQAGNFLKGKVVTLDAGAIVDGADNSFLLKLLFVGRNHRSLIDDSFGGFDLANIF